MSDFSGFTRGGILSARRYTTDRRRAGRHAIPADPKLPSRICKRSAGVPQGLVPGPDALMPIIGKFRPQLVQVADMDGGELKRELKRKSADVCAEEPQDAFLKAL